MARIPRDESLLAPEEIKEQRRQIEETRKWLERMDRLSFIIEALITGSVVLGFVCSIVLLTKIILL